MVLLLIMLFFLCIFLLEIQCVLCENLHYIYSLSYDLNIFAMLIALVVIFKSQIVNLANTIWKGINSGASNLLS